MANYNVIKYYILVVGTAYILRYMTISKFKKVVRDKSLTTGIYRFFPLQGDDAVRVAKGYLNGVNLLFWFLAIIFPLVLFVL